MYRHNNTQTLVVKIAFSLIKKIVSEVKLNHLRFNVGTSGIFVYKFNENGMPLRIEIPFDLPELVEPDGITAI